MARACLGKRECTVKADAATFGNPCPAKVNTWLYFRYTCGLARNTEPEPAAGAQYSKLWGVGGERWSASSRLADFSYAGYMANEAAIPRYPVKVGGQPACLGVRAQQQEEPALMVCRRWQGPDAPAAPTTRRAGRRDRLWRQG